MEICRCWETRIFFFFQVLYQVCLVEVLWSPGNTMAAFSFVLLMNPIIFSIFIE